MDRQSRDLEETRHYLLELRMVGVYRHLDIVRFCQTGQVNDHAAIWIVHNASILRPWTMEIVSMKEVEKEANGFGAALNHIFLHQFSA